MVKQWTNRVLAVVGASLAMLIDPVLVEAGERPALFGTREFRSDDLAALPQWRAVLARIEVDRIAWSACDEDQRACANRGVLAWRALKRGLEGASEMEQVLAINRFANQWRYRTDEQNYGRSDYWASPMEFLAQSGDCEDYAIMKYVALRELGFPADRLRLVVLRDTLRDLAHAVLAVYQGESVVILDNLTNAVLKQERLAHYAPYYSINENSRWVHLGDTKTFMSAINPKLLQGQPSGAR